MKFESIFIVSLWMMAAAPQTLLAQDAANDTIDKNDPQQVFAYRGDAILTQTAIDAAFTRIPEDSRLVFVRDGAKVDLLMRSLLQTEVVALDAEKSGFLNDPVVRERMALAARAELAQAWIEEQSHRTPPADYAAMAHEDYLAHPEKYMTEPTVSVTHILIGTKERTPEEALALATELRARLSVDPSQFNDMVKQFSDDPSAAGNKGKFRKIQRGQMVPPFEKVAFSLTTPGQISDPVETEFGYHLIRLDARQDPKVRPYEEVRERAEMNMKAKHEDSYRKAYLQKLLKDPVTIPNGAVEVMAKRWFGENLEKAPIFTEEGVK